MGNNAGNKSKNPAMTKRGRFNPNPTSCSHPSCQISARSRLDKKRYEEMMKEKVLG